MATILTSADIANAVSAVDAYITKATGIFGNMQSTVNSLTGANFIGDASDGFRDFFTGQVTPVLTENLTDASSSLTASIKAMLESIREQLLSTVDPQLGEGNRNPGGA